MIKMIQNHLKTMMNQYKPTQSVPRHDVNEVVNGSYSIKDAVIAKRLLVNGQAILGDGVLVKEKLVINGSLISKQVEFESGLEVSGATSIEGSRIKDKAVFSGTLDAKNACFGSLVELLASKSEFDNCQMDTLKIQALPFISSVQKIWLKNGTTITGDILFESGTGKVYVDASSAINGCLIGGTLIQQ